MGQLGINLLLCMHSFDLGNLGRSIEIFDAVTSFSSSSSPSPPVGMLGYVTSSNHESRLRFHTGIQTLHSIEVNLEHGFVLTLG